MKNVLNAQIYSKIVQLVMNELVTNALILLILITQKSISLDLMEFVMKFMRIVRNMIGLLMKKLSFVLNVLERMRNKLVSSIFMNLMKMKVNGFSVKILNVLIAMMLILVLNTVKSALLNIMKKIQVSGILASVVLAKAAILPAQA